MATTVTYVLAPAYSTSGISGASVQYGTGQLFDVLAALVAGGGAAGTGVGGVFTVSDPSLISALDSDPVVVRSGTTGGTAAASDQVGVVTAHRSLTPVATDVLVRDKDGVFRESPMSSIPGYLLGYAEMTQNFAPGTTAATDVSSLFITFNEPTRPYLVEMQIPVLVSNTVNTNTFASIVDTLNSVIIAQHGVFTTGLANTGASGRQGRLIQDGVPGRSRTFKVQTLGPGAGIPTINANASSAAWIRAVTV